MEGSSIANEILAELTFIWDYKGSSPIITARNSFRADALAGTRYNQLVQAVGTSWEALETGDLVKQYIVLRNLDSTNFIVWGKTVADATELIRIPPGQFAFFYLTAAASAVKADTGACDLEIRGVEGSG